MTRTKYVDKGGSSKVQFRLDPYSLDLIHAIVSAYQELVGKKPSTSLVVRRAVELLANHLAGGNVSKDNEARAIERVRVNKASA